MVASEQDTWCSMEDVFQSIEHVTSFEEWTRAFFNPNLETLKPIMQVNEESYGKTMWHYKSDFPNNGQPHPSLFNNTSRENNKQSRDLLRKSPGQQTYKHSPKKIVCYYCKREHLIKDCVKLAKEKFMDKQDDTEVARQYKNKL